MKRDHRTRRVTWLAMCGMVVLALGSTAYAVPISQGGALSVAQNAHVYEGPGTGLWNTSDKLGADATIKDQDGFTRFRIFVLGSSFSWTGNTLDQDLSDNLTPGADGLTSQARATFNGGGTWTLSGSIFDVKSGLPPIPPNAIYTGTLLTGTVSGFDVEEQLIDSNKIQSVGLIRLTVTGGWLTTNSIVQMSMLPEDYEFSLVAAGVETDSGGTLANFHEGFKAATSYQININRVPEPASVMLLALGGWWLGKRRGRVVR